MLWLTPQSRSNSKILQIRTTLLAAACSSSCNNVGNTNIYPRWAPLTSSQSPKSQMDGCECIMLLISTPRLPKSYNCLSLCAFSWLIANARNSADNRVAISRISKSELLLISRGRQKCIHLENTPAPFSHDYLCDDCPRNISVNDGLPRSRVIKFCISAAPVAIKVIKIFSVEVNSSPKLRHSAYYNLIVGILDCILVYCIKIPTSRIVMTASTWFLGRARSSST